MRPFWITFTDGSKGCCEGSNAYDAKQIAEHMTGKKVAGGEYKDFSVEPLPYPTNPRIWSFEHPIHGKTPSFCTNGDRCKSRGSCPLFYSCVGLDFLTADI